MLRLLTHLILALVLLVGQQAVLSHTLSHATGGASGEISPDKPIPSPDNCEKCASLSQLQAAIGGHHINPSVVFAHVASLDVFQTELNSVVESSYHARGPPVINQA